MLDTLRWVARREQDFEAVMGRLLGIALQRRRDRRGAFGRSKKDWIAVGDIVELVKEMKKQAKNVVEAAAAIAETEEADENAEMEAEESEPSIEHGRRGREPDLPPLSDLFDLDGNNGGSLSHPSSPPRPASTPPPPPPEPRADRPVRISAAYRRLLRTLELQWQREQAEILVEGDVRRLVVLIAQHNDTERAIAVQQEFLRRVPGHWK